MSINTNRMHRIAPVESPGSFSLSPSHRKHERKTSSGDSLTTTMTKTNQTSNTDETHSQKRVDADHQLYILEPDSADIQQVPVFTLHLSSVKRYSSILYEHLMKDHGNGTEFSTLSASKPLPLHVCADTLRLFVSPYRSHTIWPYRHGLPGHTNVIFKIPGAFHNTLGVQVLNRSMATSSRPDEKPVASGSQS